jgi:uncharacterized membrane protein YhiD involved in acid resistance
MFDWLALSGADPVEWREALFAVLLAFGLTQAVALVYVWTFRGLSYSRAAVQTMALVSILTCMLMLAAGSSIIAGIGIAGGISIVRFRTTMRDPRDVVFVFASVAIGIAAGAQAYSAALVCTAVFLAATLGLHAMSYGSQKHMDGLLRFTAAQGGSVEEAITLALRKHCRSFVLVTLREAAQGTVLEHAYQISIPDAENRAPLVAALQAVPGVEDVTLLLQEPTLDL